MIASAPFVPGEFYHFFNRANSQDDRLFYQDRNYAYFLRKWGEYLDGHFDVWTYCLIPNHFHFLLRVHTKADGTSMEHWRRLAIAYTQAINRQEGRRGSLFQEHPKHLRVETDAHLACLIRYIHRNPVHHGLVQEPGMWRYSGYRAFFSPSPSRLKREEVLGLFGSLKAFETFHQVKYEDDSSIKYCLVE
ncbi:MAG: hypothetical protein NTX45_07645 [Proteobacteria bacterium]|nr:hypothetical protein [Pseudomonadota bacterium]